MKISSFQVSAIYVGNFQFSAGGWFQAGGDLDHLIVVKIKPGDGVVGARRIGFFFDRDRAAPAVHLDDAVPLRIFHGISKDGGPARSFGGAEQAGLKSLAVKNIIAEDQGRVVAADEFSADDKGLGQSFGFGLYGVADGNTHLAAVAEEKFEIADVSGRGNQ